MHVWIMNSLGTNIKHVVNGVGIFHDKLLWIVFLVNNTGMNNSSYELYRGYNTTHISKCQPECMNSKWMFSLCSGAP